MNRRSVLESTTSPSTMSKPIELYAFIDPTCTNCWSLQSLLRKFQVEYEQYFTLQIVLKTSLPKMNIQCIQEIQDSKACERIHPAFPSIAVKAAEFQGKRAGFRYLSKLFEYTFLKSRNVSSFSVLVEIAERLNLDVEEFICDFSSKNVLRSLQVDFYLAQEMEVDSAPTFVFFNENIEDEGLKVSGLYSYEVYEQILEELLGETLVPYHPPTLEELFTRFDTLSTDEVAAIYHIPSKDAERELKKKLLLQQVERLPLQESTLWRRKTTNLL